MCGICGVLEYGRSTPGIDEPTLVRMSDSIRHRGPDDSGVFVSPGRTCGFGFRRLSIVDLSTAGHQPMQTADGSVTIVYNGEIYNHAVIRRRLEQKGYRYRSRSDTETILYCYQEYGLDFVHHLLGMFAIALWDEPRQRLVLVRDRIGIKPLYYTFRDGRLVFGSEIKALLTHPDVPRELNPAALEQYLTFLVPPAPMTMFAGINKLEPAHWMTVLADGTVKREQYWSPIPSPDRKTIDLAGEPVTGSAFAAAAPTHGEADAVETIRTILRQSIKDRMMSDVPFGVFLSGGIDSSTNVALMAELMGRPVDTFSVGFRDLERYNELGYARQVASTFKTNHREIIIDQKDAFDFLPTLVHHQDEPLADPVCIPLYFVSKLARESGTIVVQVGEGSDEEFAGYESVRRELRFSQTVWPVFRALPGVARRGIYAAAREALRKSGSHLVLDYMRRGVEGDELSWGAAVNFTEEHLRWMMRRRSPAPRAHDLVRQWHEEVSRDWPEADTLQRMIALEFRQRLPELLLMRVDKMSMATSIEARVPFLDHRFVEYALPLSSSWKLRNGKTKYILKKAVEGIIPDNIIHRKKQGFAAPVTEWLRGPWSGFAESMLMSSSFINDGWFDADAVRALLRLGSRGDRLAGQLTWNLLNLTMWHRHWLEGRSL